MDFLGSLWYYEEDVYIINSEVSTIKVPEMNTRTTNMTFPTRQVTTFSYTHNGCTYPTPRYQTRIETYSKMEFKNTRTKGFDLYRVTVSYTKDKAVYDKRMPNFSFVKEDNPEHQKMYLIFDNKETAEKAKSKLYGPLKFGVWMGGYYIPEIDYYSYRDNYFATVGALSVACLATIGLMGLCFHFAYKE